jgi:hypothetical protein
MKIIWAINDPAFWDGANLLQVYKTLGDTCNCSDNAGFMRYFINLVRNLPATWGYYVGDEVSLQDHDKMKAYSDFIKQLDPYHPRLAISGENSTSLGANMKPFIDTTDVIGSAVYPISASEPIATVGKVAHSLQSTADANDKQMVMVLQSFSASQYGACSPSPGCARFPSQNEMRQMLALTMKNSQPRFILWYSYFNVLASDNPSAYWKSLVQAAGVNTTVTSP